jgi:ATPase subunit of ABC transporter with duplicated ATPase domains
MNGSGKSSLLRIMAGEDKEFEGEAVPMPNMRIGFLPQEPKLDSGKTVRDTVEEGLGDILDAKKKLEEIYAAYAEPMRTSTGSPRNRRNTRRSSRPGADSDLQMEIAADALRLPAWDAKIEHLSGGEKRRVALCRLLLSKPDMLLLDEPTNHLDAESVDWLEQFLQKFPGTVIAVTHDRYFFDNAAEWILNSTAATASRGRATTARGWSRRKPASRPRPSRKARDQGDANRAGMGALESESAAGQEQGAHPALRGAFLARAPEAQRDAGNLHSGGGAPG